MKRLYAIPYDGTLEGDNTFYCPGHTIQYKTGMTLENIRQAWVNHTAEGCSKEEWLEIDKDSRDIKGAWIVDNRGLKACHAVWESNPGNDSATYACNQAAKYVAAEICVKELKK